MRKYFRYTSYAGLIIFFIGMLLNGNRVANAGIVWSAGFFLFIMATFSGRISTVLQQQSSGTFRYSAYSLIVGLAITFVGLLLIINRMTTQRYVVITGLIWLTCSLPVYLLSSMSARKATGPQKYFLYLLYGSLVVTFLGLILRISKVANGKAVLNVGFIGFIIALVLYFISAEAGKRDTGRYKYSRYSVFVGLIIIFIGELLRLNKLANGKMVFYGGLAWTAISLCLFYVAQDKKKNLPDSFTKEDVG